MRFIPVGLMHDELDPLDEFEQDQAMCDLDIGTDANDWLDGFHDFDPDSQNVEDD